jgi:hypothetical protein
MPSELYDEMVNVLGNVATVNRVVTRPFIEKKTGLQVVSEGEDLGNIVTEADKNVSLYLLDGGIKGIKGMREVYKGSFSEEDDSSDRLNAKTIYQVDPIDGTGDFKLTYTSKNVIGATTLVSKLTRKSLEDKFNPIGGIIFDTLNQIALISDGKQIGLYKVAENAEIQEVPIEIRDFKHGVRDTQRINRRVCYPQLTFDGAFMKYLQEKGGLEVKRVNVGGAGTLALQFFRNYIHPKEEVKGFSDLETISTLFNAQPDWKTWDTDPTEVIANALGLPRRTSVFGEELKANASKKDLNQMHHTQGYVLAPNMELGRYLTDLARDFQHRNPDANLLEKDYDFTKEILALKA